MELRNITEFFTELEDLAAEQISGGKDKWPELFGQPLPPGLYKNFTESASSPEGLSCGCDGNPKRGTKNGFDEEDRLGTVLIPPGIAN